MPRLGYYGQQWPFPQGAAVGPYPMFAGPLRGLPHAAQPQCGVVMVGRRMIHLSPQRRPLPCVCHTQAVKMRARRRRLGAMGDAGVPAGSQLVYNVSWANTLLSKISTAGTTGNSQWTLSAVVPALAAQGISVVQQSTTGTLSSDTSGFRLVVQTSTDFNQPSDVRSIIDHYVYQSLGLLPNSPGSSAYSTISTASLASPTTPAGTPVGTNNTAAAQDMANYQAAVAAGDTAGANMWQAQYQADSGIAPPFNLGTWLSNNWPLAAGVGLAAVVIWKVA